MRFRPRSGTSLVELVVAMVSLALLAAITAAFFRVQTHVATVVSGRSESLDAIRTVVGLADRELRFLAPGDFAAAADSVALRAFRGAGVVCDTARGEANVRYIGIRDPDPTKDSLLVADSSALVVGLMASRVAAPSACSLRPGEQALSLRAAHGLVPGTSIVVFERGVYLFAAGAFRYRRGRSGRQPVTAEVFDDATSGFVADPPGAGGGSVRVRLGRSTDRPADVGGSAWPVDVRVSQPNGDTLEVHP
jgi:hypothetical protein